MIDKEKIRQAVLKGIEQMPSQGEVFRQPLNNYNEPEGEPILVTTITGFFYKKDSQINISLLDQGEIKIKPSTRFLVDYNEESAKVKTNDVLKINGVPYKVIDPGENFKIYCDMVVEQDG